MKIAVWHNLPSGGGKRALADHIRGLLARGHEIESWSPPTADLSYAPFGAAVREHVVPLTVHGRTDWDKRLRIPARTAPLVAAMRAHCRQCAAEMAAGDFDVLFANSCHYFGTAAIGRYVSLPKAIYLQEPYRSHYEARPRLPWLPPPSRATGSLLSRWRTLALDRRSLANARTGGHEEVGNAAAFDRILVNSHFSRESILRSYGLDAEVCYLGVDTSHFVDLALPREHLVLGFGAYHEMKNIPLAIRAVAAMAPPRPRLAWIGNTVHGDTLSEAQAMAGECGIDFTGHVRIPDSEIVDLLNRASALIYAPRLEPFGLAPLEAAACGLPCVAVAEGGVRETVLDGETGLLVANRPEAMAAALERLLADPALVHRLGRNGRAHVEQNFSFAAATGRIERALQDVVATAAHRRPA